MKTVAIIPADEAEPIRFDEVEGRIDLDYLQKQVGGYIEAVGIDRMAPLPPFSMYLNEEGKLEGLPLNRRATLLARGTIGRNDYIAGTAVLCGPVDDDGYDTGLTAGQIQYLEFRS